MNDRHLVENMYYDDDGGLRIQAAPGYELLAKWMKSDLWGTERGPYPELRAAVMRGLRGERGGDVTGNGFAVEVDGDLVTITLLSRPEVDLRVSGEDMLAALDFYAEALQRARS